MKIQISKIIFFISLFCSVFSQNNSFLRTAKMYEMQKNWDAAISIYNDVLNKNPNNYQTIRSLKELYKKSHRYKEGINFLVYQISRNPNDIQLNVELGEFYFLDENVEEAKRILKLVGLSGKESRKAYMLSGGEKRRVAIARALMQKPTILLADEIVSELDHVTSREIMNLISDAQKKMNLTAIMVHHDMKLALEYANRVAVIKEGQKILEIGVEGDTIVDFQTGDMSIEEIMEMYNTDTKE